MNLEQLPSGRWRVRVSFRGTKAAGTADTKVDAQVLGGTLLAQLGAVSDDDQRFGVFLLTHIATATLSPSTKDDYERVVKRFLATEHRLIELPARAITTPKLVQLYDELAKAEWSTHRVSRLHVVISAAFKRARRYGLVAVNPATGAAPKTPPKPDIKVPSTDDVARLLDAAGPHFTPALTLLATTGMRRGELVALKWSDVDLVEETLTIRRAVSCTTKTGVVVRDTVKNGAKGERVIALDSHTAAVLRQHRYDVIEFYAKLRHPFSDDDWIFKDKWGKPRRPDWATQRFVRMRKQLGLDHVRLYDLRHFMVTSMLASGAPPTTVAGRAGHDVVTMMRRYVHFMPASDRSEASAFVAAIQAKRRSG
jgi:integrase